MGSTSPARPEAKAIPEAAASWPRHPAADDDGFRLGEHLERSTASANFVLELCWSSDIGLTVFADVQRVNPVSKDRDGLYDALLDSMSVEDATVLRDGLSLLLEKARAAEARTHPKYHERVASAVRQLLQERGEGVEDLAVAIGTDEDTARAKFEGLVPLNVVELASVMAWLNVPASALLPRLSDGAAHD